MPSCNVRTAELKAEQSTSYSVSAGDPIELIWSAWIESTKPRGAVILTAKRRRIVQKALDSHGQADCIDAVRGWRHSAHHRGQNKDQRVYNSLELLLRDAEHIEMFRDLERRHGTGGNVAGDCPGPTPSPLIAGIWAPIAAQLEQLVLAPGREIWLSTLHLHAAHDGVLVAAVAPAVHAWVSDRFIKVIRDAAGGRQVTIVQCELKAAAT